ncbi:MAG TPA: PD-(D/E)XK nuclease-like domain-containing protein [Candidatus Competibacteraceae bacterium]|nr:PD-(D/E)XK nuclease-like domain-containing protein [Candidatus Competibacteraceae bacterium]HSA45537.1 PD-(D/E)XK nuclease-like domain-containing protein [Candidatus Competibacteraceae bacterium]
MLSNRSYFQMPGVSSHALIEIARTPLHCWAKYLDPDRPDEEPTAAMRFGTLVHALVLAPETFSAAFFLADAINRRTNAGKAEHAVLRESGQQAITPKEYRAALEIVKAIQRHPVAGTLFKAGEPEKVLTVAREPHRLPLKGRLDWLNPQPAIVELKTASDASREGFLRAVYRHGYHLSAAYYRMLVGRATGTPETDIPHTFVVVEPKPPYAVAVYPTSEGVLAEGRDLWETNLARFDDCWTSQDWPSYPVESLKPSSGMGSGLRLEIEEGELEL